MNQLVHQAQFKAQYSQLALVLAVPLFKVQALIQHQLRAVLLPQQKYPAHPLVQQQLQVEAIIRSFKKIEMVLLAILQEGTIP